jgi:hypothetical protein
LAKNICYYAIDIVTISDLTENVCLKCFVL